MIEQRFDEKRRSGYLTASAAALAILTYLVLFADEKTLLFFAGREQLFEILGAVLFLASSLLCAAAYRYARRAEPSPFPRRVHLYLLLAAFFFVAFGEEVSWGQMIFGFEAPEAVAKRNQQGELNLHNLTLIDAYGEDGRKSGWRALVTANRLFDYFMLGLFVAAPLAARWIAWTGVWLERRAIYLIPGIFCTALWLNLVLTGASEFAWGSDKLVHGAISEIREFNYAYLCFAGFLFLFLKERGEVEQG